MRKDVKDVKVERPEDRGSEETPIRVESERESLTGERITLIPTFGLCMIVKNAAHCIERILQYASRFDQVVIVDTGSDDGTPDLIKQKYPDVQLEHFQWINNFAAARNYALSFLTTDTWIWLDADDTFTEATFEKWKNIATSLYQHRDTQAAVMLPYHYAVDQFGEPLVIQYRERIFVRDPERWEWREPIHEVCCQIEGTKPDKAVISIPDAPVIHKSSGEGRDGMRNWRILNNHLLEGHKDLRTTYYIQTEALGRGQFEYSLQMADLLEQLNPTGFYRYEMLKHRGEAYWQLYKRDGVQEYTQKAIKALQEAIDYVPDRNEAREILIHIYTDLNKIEEALDACDDMKEDILTTTMSALADKYGLYKYALKTNIYLRYLDLPYNTITNHLKSLDTQNVHPLVFQNDDLLRKYLDMNHIGIIYAEEKYFKSAKLLMDALLRNNLFKRVVIIDNPLVQNFGRVTYFHFSDDVNTAYMEDSHPDLIKYFISDQVELPWGWHDLFDPPTTVEEADKLVEAMTDPVNIVYKPIDLIDLARQSKAGWKSHTFVNFGTKDILKIMPLLNKGRIESSKIRLLVSEDNRLVGLYGMTATVNSLIVKDQSTWVVPDFRQFELLRCQDLGIENSRLMNGIPFHIQKLEKPRKSIAFFAPGIEEWDGTTPFRKGIGASETSVIYVAEEMAKVGLETFVYCPVRTPRTVSGVHYIPSAQFPKNGEKTWDIFVASRAPGLLNQRRAKKQYLWLHDVPGAYGNLSGLVCDKFICVSDWQQQKLVEWGVPDWKTIVIPNGIPDDVGYDFGAKVKENSAIWLSQPERGIENLLEVGKGLLDQIYLAYGFYNFRAYNPTNFANFHQICEWKNELRAKGVKIVGRLPIQTLRTLMRQTEYWIYPSTFEETFCVTALEAANAGCKILACENGATTETLKKAVDVGRANLMPGKYSSADKKKWTTKLKALKNTPQPDPYKINEDFRYDSIVEAWLNGLGVNLV